jgi:hypothetical protein
LFPNGEQINLSGRTKKLKTIAEDLKKSLLRESMPFSRLMADGASLAAGKYLSYVSSKCLVFLQEIINFMPVAPNPNLLAIISALVDDPGFYVYDEGSSEARAHKPATAEIKASVERVVATLSANAQLVYKKSLQDWAAGGSGWLPLR